MSHEVPRCFRCKRMIGYDDGFHYDGMCESCYVCQMFDALSHEEQEAALQPLPAEIEEQLPF